MSDGTRNGYMNRVPATISLTNYHFPGSAAPHGGRNKGMDLESGNDSLAGIGNDDSGIIFVLCRLGGAVPKSARKKPSCWRKANKDKEGRSGMLPLLSSRHSLCADFRSIRVVDILMLLW